MSPMLLVFFAIMIVAMFFMNSRQRKAQQAQREKMNTMAPGDEVITIGGLHGVLSVISADQKTVDIDCEGVILTFEKSAIRTFVSAAEKAPANVEATAETVETVEAPADNTADTTVESPIEEDNK